MKIVLLYTKRDIARDAYSLEDSKGRDRDDDVFAVNEALKQLGHETILMGVNLQTYSKLRRLKGKIDSVFNLCDDGFFSKACLEPHLPAMLDILGIPYTGSGYFSLALCLNKALTKQVLLANNLPTPKFQVFNSGKEVIDKRLRFPLIVKPAFEDASIGIREMAVVKNKRDLIKRVRDVIKRYKQAALVEEFIDGREVNVGILSKKEILPLAEIKFDLPKGMPNIVSYNAKWCEKSKEYIGTVRQCPAKLNKGLKAKIKRLALDAFRITGCSGHTRVDFRIDKNGEPYVLEVNPNPDISKDAGLAAMAKAAGYSYEQLVQKIVVDSLEK